MSVVDSTAAATIYYTTDGTTPTATSTKFTTPITVNSNETVQAIAIVAGNLNSAVASAVYAFMVPAPNLSLASGSYNGTPSLAITDTNALATIYYTIDGTTPTALSTKYTTAVTVNPTQTVEAIAIIAGYTNSPTTSATYTSATAQPNVNLRIMPIGDSITAGYLSTTADGYRGPLAVALANKVATLDYVGSQIDGSMADPDNEGHFGDEISDIAGLITGELNNYKPNLVTLDIGTNDLGRAIDLPNAPNRLASLIDQIIAAEPDATVLVGQVIVNGDPTIGSEVVTFNNALPAIVQARASAGKHIYLVDMSAVAYPADMNGTLHPNDAGYQLMANAWDAAIQAVIAKGWITDPIAGSASRPTGTVYSGVAGMCLDDFNGSGTAGVKADVSGCKPIPAQQWNLDNSQVVINSLCLDVVGGGTGNNTLVDLWSCNGATNQTWLAKNGTLVNPISGRCLDNPGSSTTDGTQLKIMDCSGGAEQQWRVPSQGSIASGVSGECLDAPGGNAANLTPVDISSCNNTAAQQWAITNNTLTFDGRCLNVTGAGTSNGTLIDLETCVGGTNQVWTPVNGTLVNPASGRCLDIPSNSTNGVHQLDILDCSGGTNQQWTLPAETPQS